MQPETGASEDIHAILGRFSNWTATQSTNGNGRSLQVGSDEVRELAYEEAIRRYGSWPPVLTTMAKRAAPAPQTAEQSVPSSPTISETPQSTVAASALPGAAESPEGSDAVSGVEEKANVRKAATARKRSSPKGNAAGKSAKALHALTASQENTAIAKTAAPSQENSDLVGRSATPVPTATEKKHMAGADCPASRGKKNVAPSAENEPADAPKNGVTRRSAFREVLAHTVEAPPAVYPNSERITRISIRLSSQEESLVRKSAAQAGLTVSAWLRNCALQTEARHTLAAEDVSTRPSQGGASRTKPQPLPGLGARLAVWLLGWRQRSV